MGEGLQKSAGNRLRDILDKFTSNPIIGCISRYTCNYVSFKVVLEQLY